jgi:hypothetical protein
MGVERGQRPDARHFPICRAHVQAMEAEWQRNAHRDFEANHHPRSFRMEHREGRTVALLVAGSDWMLDARLSHTHQ